MMTSPPISHTEHQVLEFLDTAGCTLTGRDGRVRWALDADDVVCLLELGGELAGAAADAATWNRVGTLLGATGPQ